MFREVPMVEIREVLRLNQMGYGLRRISELLGMDRKTVRRYLAVAETVGYRPESSEITDSLVTEVLVALQPGRPGGWHGEVWALLEGQHGLLKQWVEDGLHLTKIRVLLQRRGWRCRTAPCTGTASQSWALGPAGRPSGWTTGNPDRSCKSTSGGWACWGL